MDDTITHTNESVSTVIYIGTSLGSKSTTVAVCKPDNKQNRCKMGKNLNMRSSVLLTLSAHARECSVVTLSVCHSVCVSLFDFGEGTLFRVETYISTF